MWGIAKRLFKGIIFLLLFLLWVRPPRFQSLLIMGWCYSKPEHRLWLHLDSVPIFKVSMFPFRADLGSFPLPPLWDSSGRLALPNILPVSSLLLSFFLLSVHNAYSAAPLQCLVPPIVRPPSSVRRRATNPPAPADQCPLLVSWPSVPYAGLHPPPPPTYTAGGTWLGCGCVWRGEKGDAPPRLCTTCRSEERRA